MRSGELRSRVQAAAEASELVQAVRSVAADGGVRFALGDSTLRALTRGEIEQLVVRGNIAEDWSRISVADGFDPLRVLHCNFHGDVVLGRFTGRAQLAPGLEVPTGIAYSTIANSVVGHDATIRHVPLVVQYVLATGVVIQNCGSIVGEGPTAFGNGQELPIAIETGGREVPIFAEIDIEIAAIVARLRSDRHALAEYIAAIADYTARATSQRGIVAQGATIRDTLTIRNSYVGPRATIDGATRVSESTILSSASEPVEISAGACISRSILQWGCHATTMSIVDSSVLTEHSHVERHGKVSASFLGPNTGVAEGEVTACLLGPFVGFHHQALLIAAFWPEGKGNVGYGANVGSNHTSKAPDQEFWPGEGAFLGLGTNIKYPADLSRAPYTIIATGVTTLPQKVTFPFSLINSPSASFAGISPAYNEIVPAWLLTDNLFALKRNEAKYKSRNRAKRTQFQFDVLRPETVDFMVDACERLESVQQVKGVYTDRDIEGLGKNFMVETYRKPAIEAYRFYIRYYALRGLLDYVRSMRENRKGEPLGALLTTPADHQPWEHQRRILHNDLGLTDVTAALRQLPPMLEKVAQDVERSKAKDDERGVRIIDDYADVHTPAARDKFVLQTWEETRRLTRELEEWILSS